MSVFWRTRGRHRPTKTTPKTYLVAYAGLKGSGSSTAERHYPRPVRGLKGEDPGFDSRPPAPLVQTWETCRTYGYQPPSTWQQLLTWIHRA